MIDNKILKKSEKNRLRFLKMDILKMSNFQTLEVNVCKKCGLLGHRVKFQKFNSKIVSIIFYYFI